jgi:hypothetical protein
VNLQTYNEDFLKAALFDQLNKVEPRDPYWMLSQRNREAALQRLLSWRTEYLRQSFVAWATGDTDTADAFNDRIADLMLAIDHLSTWIDRED